MYTNNSAISSKRYASALFRDAKEKDKLSVVAKDMSKVLQELDPDSPDMRSFSLSSFIDKMVLCRNIRKENLYKV